MELQRVWYLPTFTFKFDKADIALITEISTNHYDLVCKRVSTDETSWLARLITQQQNNSLDLIADLTWRDLDLFAKIMEMASYRHLVEERERGTRIFTQICNALRGYQSYPSTSITV